MTLGFSDDGWDCLEAGYRFSRGISQLISRISPSWLYLLFCLTVGLLNLLTYHYYLAPRSKQRGKSKWALAIYLLVFNIVVLVWSLAPSPSLSTWDERDGVSVTPNIRDPNAINPQSVCSGYKAYSIVESLHGLTADLILTGDACDVYGKDIKALRLVVEYQAPDRLHVEILPKYIGKANESWFILPESLVPKPENPILGSPYNHLEFSYKNEPTFSFTVTRKLTGDILFSTEGSHIVYEDQFIEFGSSLPENYNLYGLGETIRGFRLGNNLTRTLHTADVGDIVDANLYGVHPTYIDTRYFEIKDGLKLEYAPNATDTSAKYTSYTHGVFFRNAHSQEVLLRESNITWRALGGTVDLYFFSGPGQEEVTKSYQASAIGLPAMQQYWTFGYHHCRWGYKNWSETQDVVAAFEKHQIPLETIWNDIDYMKAYRNFENDPVRFSYETGVEFLSKLHENNQHYIPIIDAGIYVPKPGDDADAYPVFDRGVEQEAFVLNSDGSLYIGEVWPGYCVWADWIGALFADTGANRWWISEIIDYYQKIPFDGIWADMNEVASFCSGSCGNKDRDYGRQSLELRSTPDIAEDTREINFPPYAINNEKGELASHTLSPNASHHDGTRQYDFHNLFAYQLVNATYHALLEISPTKRPFIITRSTFAGSGRQAGHWGGDNYSKWLWLYLSIPQALSFSLYGIPMFGVDTCGFDGDSNEELCNRWMQLSAFFPFYRNHNEINGIPQEPYVWPSVAEASRVAMKIRYALLPYIYTTFYWSHKSGSTTMRALAWEFPNEPWLAVADRQFLLGKDIMVIPVLNEGATTVDGVFPGGGSGTVWYDWYTQTAVTGVKLGENVTIDAPLGHIPVFVRGGAIIPMQEPAMTTTAARATPWSLLVALVEGAASGGLYLDDGESLNPEATTWVDFLAWSSSLRVVVPIADYIDTNPMGNVTILGIEGKVSKVMFDGAKIDPQNWHFNSTSKALHIKRLDELTKKGAFNKGWTLSWE
ncbi:family 31 glycosyl hydrolase [Xylariaceae sp. FL0255]|nr:family 31 glycosyl hydrolase [Xylariaceae sp. FL0255]